MERDESNERGGGGRGFVLRCVRIWSFQSSPSCVGSVLWRVRTLSFQSSPVCGPCAVVYGDFEIFHKTPLCVVPVLWCVRTWSFQSSPSCVGSVLWRVRTLRFQSSHLCELCAVRYAYLRRSMAPGSTQVLQL